MPGREGFKELEQRVRELERKIAQLEQEKEKISENLKNYRWLAENARDGIVLATDPGGLNIYANQRMSELTGFTIPELLRIGIKEAIHPNEYKRIMEIYRRRMAGMPAPISYETVIVRKDGKKVSVEISGSRTIWEGRICVMAILRDITDRKKAEEALRTKNKDLEVKSKQLKEANTALRVLLKVKEEDKADLEGRMLSNVKQMVIPFIEKLKKTELDSNQRGRLKIIESKIYELISPFSSKLSVKYGLTATQLRIADLVRSGATNKEIADFLNVSIKTVETHRKHIRKKTGTMKKKFNLRSFLLSIE